MLIDSLKIPIGLDLKPLSGDVGKATAQLDRFASAAAPVVPVSFEIDERDLTKHLKSVAKAAGEHFVVDAAVKKLAPAAAKASNPVALGMAGVDATAGKVADVTIGVSQSALKAGLSAATATVKASVAAMAKVAVVPLTVASLGMSVGFAVAQALLLKKIKEMTGWSNVRLIVTYAAVKVGLAIATRLVKAAVGAMVKVATFPIRLSLAALRVSLRMAKSLVVGTMNQIKAAAHAATAAVSGVLTGGLGLGVLGGLVGVPAALAGSVKAASDLNETVSKTGFVFKDATKIVTAGADEMARDFGVPRQQFLEGASSIGLIGKAAKLTDSEAAKLSVGFAKLAADAASFYNIPVDEALEKFRSGLVGEAEPMRALGVLLDEDTVKAKALAMGLVSAGKGGKGVAGELTQAQKVMARAALITEGLRVAQGDLARTADSLANRMRELWGRVQTLGETIGQFLLPAAQSLARTLNEMIKGAQDGLAKGSGSLAAWAESLRKAADWVGIIYRNFRLVRQGAATIFTDALANLWDNLKKVMNWTLGWAKYFAQVIGEAIEKAVTNALHHAFPNSVGPYYAKGLPPMPPEMPDLGYKAGGGLSRILLAMQGNEGLAGLAAAAKGAKDALAGMAARVPGLVRQAQTGVAGAVARGNAAAAAAERTQRNLLAGHGAMKLRPLGPAGPRQVLPELEARGRRADRMEGIGVGPRQLDRPFKVPQLAPGLKPGPLMRRPNGAAQRAEDEWFRGQAAERAAFNLKRDKGFEGFTPGEALKNDIFNRTQKFKGVQPPLGLGAGREPEKFGGPKKDAKGDVNAAMAAFAKMPGLIGGMTGALAGGPAAALGGLVAGQIASKVAAAAPKETRLAGLAEMGSREAYSAVARHQANAGNKGVEGEVKKSNKYLERIAKAAEQKPGAKQAAVPVFSFG